MTYLRELERDDLKLLNVWRNDREVIAHLGSGYIYIAPEIDERWYEHYLSNRDLAVRLAILPEPKGNPIGIVNLTSVQSTHRTAEFSILIGEKDFWSKGHGERATRLMISHGFGDLNLNRIYLSVLEGNERAHKLYEKVGFAHEGVHCEALYKDGRYHNVVTMALLRSRYK